tara:strand:- start:823 stop:1767 length:945 start_codon:yes stop_codon:yes gene_type:complete
MKSEQDFIKYLEKIKVYNKNIVKSIGDDCAIVKFDSKKNYVFTTDTSLLGPHFTKDYTPEEIGHKSLATNISDIASMGCIPLYALYALTLPKMSDTWIKKFFNGSKPLLKKHKISIIGGDTTKGPLSITIQLIGVQKNKILVRSGANIGDGIYVTGTIGNARAALLLNKKSVEYKYFRKYLVKPTPRVDVGLELSKFASSCIDISDGIAKDLKSIAVSSDKGFIVDIDLIPTKLNFMKYINPKYRDECILGGGEDYELCFTSSDNNIRKINDISKKHKIKITRIGTITDNGFNYEQSGVKYVLNTHGYDHFKDS